MRRKRRRRRYKGVEMMDEEKNEAAVKENRI